MALNKNQKTDLGFLGEDFQIELVKLFIEDQPFFQQIESVVDQNMFTVDTLRRIVGFMKDRYNKYQSVTTYKGLDTIIRSEISNQTEVERCIGTLEQIQSCETRGIDLVEGNAKKFFLQQHITKACNKILNIVKDGDISRYYEAEDIMRDALIAGNKEIMGYNPMDGIEEALSDEYRCEIPTGASELDKVLMGGLAKGELGVIIAPSSVGKTSATTGFAAYAATYKCEKNNYKGFKVVHIHFEDKPVDIKRKYYAYLTDVDACDLSKPDIRPQVIQTIKNNEYSEMIKRNVICLDPTTGEMSASEIKTKLRQIIANGFIPDLVIIDYFECLKLEKPETSADSEWSREGLTMRKVESIAKEFNVAVWCPVQGTKDSFDQQIVGIKNAGGSVKKVQIAHVIISFARTEQMRLENKINILINKFRGGRISKNNFMNVTFNNGTTKFDFSTMTEIDDALDGDSQNFQNQVGNDVKKNLRPTRY